MHLFINNKAGTVLKSGEAEIRALIEKSQALFRSVNFISPDDISGHLQNLIEDDAPVLIGGGDGTIASCLPYFIKHNKTLGILPLGTMNMIAQDLGFSSDLAAVLALYSGETSVAKIDVGHVNDLPFLCCVGYGTMPESAVFREENRGTSDFLLYPQLVKFVFDQMDPHKQRRIIIKMDKRSKRLKTAAVVVSNNLFKDSNEGGGGIVARGSLQDGQLGIYTVSPRSGWDKIRIALRLRLGGWQQDKTINEWRSRTVEINGQDKEALISLDGEVYETQMPLRFHIVPQCLQVLVPAHNNTMALEVA